MNPLALFLLGPTAVGKTALAIELVQRLPIEIISVDSALVYRGLDIGSGKPTRTELARAPHHLIDIREPNEPYSAAQFCHDALLLMKDITARGKIPLLVGGTMLYFKALLEGLSPLPGADPKVRAKILAEANEVGWPALHEKLARIDPKSASRIHPNDPQRLQRALEVYELTSRPMSYFFEKKEIGEKVVGEKIIGEEEQEGISHYRNIAFALIPTQRSDLHQRIEARFDKMLASGLLDEVKRLQLKYQDIYQENPHYFISLPALRAVGYRQVVAYLLGQNCFEEMRMQAIYATRQLAKRQFTWLKNLQNSNKFYFFQNLAISLEKNKPLDLLPAMIDCIDQLLAGGNGTPIT